MVAIKSKASRNCEMTPEQIRNARKRIGLSCSEFAAALGFTGKQKHMIRIHF
jgi:DNA-binding transcriptional regulator YiaG